MAEAVTVEQLEMGEAYGVSEALKDVVHLWEQHKKFQDAAAKAGGVIPASFAAKMLNLSKQRVHDLIKSGKLERVPLEGFETIFVSSDSVKRWALAEHKAGRPCKVRVPSLKETFSDAADVDWAAKK